MCENLNLTFKERIRLLTNKSKNGKIKSFTLFRLSDNNKKYTKFNKFSELRTKALEKYLNKGRNSLKQKRLNEIFDKEKNNSISKNFNQKFKEVFNETLGDDNQLNSKLILYINNLKKLENQENINNNIFHKDNNSNFLLQNLSQRNNNSHHMIFNYNLNNKYIPNDDKKSCTIKNENSSQNIGSDFNTLHNKLFNYKKLKHHSFSSFRSCYKNSNIKNKNYEKDDVFNSLKYYESILFNLNKRLDKNKGSDLYSIKKNKTKKFNFN
jgi:hypothetical protein